ncbi:hypothetical protein FJO69_02645 [[Mycoplasma] falconis]|uniref:Uncharacterized protein n=1 Tax=[Mycoplasma] falconis TaxID=92403 RepID=A0A501X912_9BACT|nr:hypothetical protein [[Mycoplasma] falconis]TPE56919.1 hypothetical protein FJO69_02645 [[Mycoplasma] falconis]
MIGNKQRSYKPEHNNIDKETIKKLTYYSNKAFINASIARIFMIFLVIFSVLTFIFSMIQKGNAKEETKKVAYYFSIFIGILDGFIAIPTFIFLFKTFIYVIIYANNLDKVAIKLNNSYYHLRATSYYSMLAWIIIGFIVLGIISEIVMLVLTHSLKKSYKMWKKLNEKIEA